MVSGPLFDGHEPVTVRVHEIEVLLLVVLLRRVPPGDLLQSLDACELVDPDLEEDLALLETQFAILVGVSLSELCVRELLHFAATF